MRTSGRCLLIATLASSVACSEPDPPRATPRQTPTPQPARTAFAITAVTPEQLALEGDRVGTQTLTVSYSIPDPATVTEAQLKLYVGEIGNIATQTVTAGEHEAQFVIEPSPHSLGATVRFRASCSSGTTDWFTLGQMPDESNPRGAKVFRIDNVTPQSIRWSEAMGEGQGGVGARVSIWGSELPGDCRIEAQANGSSIELNNVLYFNRRYQGLLKYEDIGDAPISPRYAELKLHITRTGQRVEAVRRIPFLER
ncbi:MAG TPA: hypothetical protein VJN96_07820 [Vicinamibacterales bacterium]|nr:hypothetical protein [Vicinamibacterales bacterium]